ncbi:MAG: heparinase II/III-family protein [Candidatus Omnitrophica bacterium]|nr:heparinase II/III-family protein [Candidatus Omnitrophota bacterium]
MDLERKYFKRSLVYPKNLIIDGFSFLRYFGRALKLRLYKRCKPAHTWTKARPAWLPDCSNQNLDVEPENTNHKHYIKYEGSLCGDGLYSSFGKKGWPDNDPEKYWCFHRWGWLSSAFLEGSVSGPEAVNWIEKWIKNNKDYNDPSWEPFSCSERIANIFFLRENMSDKERDNILSGPIKSFIIKSANWIIQHLEYYGPVDTNNHILNNARALFIAAGLTKNYQFSKVAFSIFENMLPVLISKEGFLRERSSHYQVLVLRWILDVKRMIALDKDILKNNNHIDFILYYVNILSKATAYICDSKGMLKVLIGDVSPDSEPKSLCNSLKAFYPEWNKRSCIENSGSKDESWFFLKEGRLEVITNQPHEYPVKYSNHGHADISSFAFLFDGQQVLVDPGRNNYTKEPLSRDFISGFFHNVPLVDGIPPVPAPFFKRWIPASYGSVRVKSNLTDKDCITVEHDGFNRTGSKILHVRSIFVDKRRLKVIDEFKGSGLHQITLCWHFAPGFDRDGNFKEGKDIYLSSSFCKVRINTICEDMILNNSKVSFYKASDKGGWYSPCYGTIKPALSVRIQDDLNLPVVMSTTFYIS